MTVTVDQARKKGLALDVDDPCAARQGDFAALADGFDAVFLDDDDGIFEGISTGAVDESPALYHQIRRRLRLAENGGGHSRSADQKPQKEIAITDFHFMLQREGISLVKRVDKAALLQLFCQ